MRQTRQAGKHNRRNSSERGLPSPFRRKPLTQLIGSILLTQALIVPAYAAPTNGTVVGGSGTITQSGLSTNIHQNTNLLALDWQSFSINTNEKVNFLQPNVSSIALNRVLGSNPSNIFGQLNANGHVILANPNGVFFGPTASVNVGGLIAAGMTLDPKAFMNGQFTLSTLEGTEGKVINSGIINASTGGSVSLIGKQVKNEGLIVANLGTVSLQSGNEAIVTFDNQGILGIKVTKEALQTELGVDPAALNTGTINAASGKIILTASKSRDLFTQAVNTGDIKQAKTAILNDDGSFTLTAGGNIENQGTLNVSGTTAGNITALGENITTSGQILANTEQGTAGTIELTSRDTTLLTQNSLTSANSDQGNAGQILILGNKVGIFDQATVTANGNTQGGTVLLGGDQQGNNPYLPNADFLYTGQNTTVNADAITNGNGGRVIAFASDTARIYGTLTARGGQGGGNGGFIETSGLKGFRIDTVPDVSAPNGRGGKWLIDPYNITVASDCTGATYCISAESETSPFSPIGDSSFIDVDLIAHALHNGDVEINTDGDGQQAGDINWGSATDFFDLDIDGINDTLVNGSHDRILTLNAANSISFVGGSNITDSDTNTANSLHLNLTATNGSITLNTSTLNTYGGNVELTANSGTIDLGLSGRINTGGGDFTSHSASFTGNVGMIDTRTTGTGGNLNITTTGTLDLLNGTFTTGGGYVHLTSNDGSINLGVGTLSTEGGYVDLDATNGSIDLGTRTVTTLGGDFTSDSRSFVSSVAINTTGGANTDGGAIRITATHGDIETGALTADGGTAVGSGVNGRPGGDITLTADNGSIAVNGTINTSGRPGIYNNFEDEMGRPGGNGGTITIHASDTAGTITVAAITANGANASGDHNDPASGGAGGAIDLLANTLNLNGAISTRGGDAIGDSGYDIHAGNGGSVTAIGNHITLSDNITTTGGSWSNGPDGATGPITATLTGNNSRATVNYNTFTSPVTLNVATGTTGASLVSRRTTQTTWTVDQNGNGTLTGNVRFSGIGILTGSDVPDIFNLQSNSQTRTFIVTANGGDDELNVTFGDNPLDIQYDGGAGTDALTLAGGSAATAGDTSGTYTPETDAAVFTYTRDSTNSSVRYTNAETITDNVYAERLTINGTGTDDYITLSATAFQVTSSDLPVLRPGVAYANKTGIAVFGQGGNDTVAISGSLTFDNGTVAVSAETLTTTSTVNADRLELTGLTGYGSTTNRLAIDVNELAINGATGNLYLQEAGSLNLETLSTSGSFDLTAAGAITNAGNLTANGNVLLTAGTTLNLAGTLTAGTSATLTSQDDLTVSNLTVTTGTARLDSTNGAVRGGNITANRVELEAGTGISPDPDTFLALHTGQLSARSDSGTVHLTNTGDLAIDLLQTNGDIEVRSNANFTFAPGSVNTDAAVTDRNYRYDLVMTTPTGSFLGAGGFSTSNPADITAHNATFTGPVGTFGTSIRPLVLDVTGKLIINTRMAISPHYPHGVPAEFESMATLVDVFESLTRLTGNQQTEVETLNEVNPAIFTPIRNYDHEQIAVRLPRDQLYDEVEETGNEDDREKAKERGEGKVAPVGEAGR